MTDPEQPLPDPDPVKGSGLSLRERAETAFRGKAAESSESGKTLSPEETRQILHELRVHQIELEMQNEELRRSNVELGIAHARYFDLFDLAPVAYVILNEQGLIREANLTAATMLNVSRRTLVNKPLARFVFKEDQDIFDQCRKRLLQTSEPQSCDLRMVKHDGTPFWSHLEVTTSRNEDGVPLHQFSLSDITVRKQAEAAIRKSEERLQRFIDQAPVAIAIFDRDMRYLAASRQWLSDYGILGREIMGLSHNDLFPEIPERWREVHRRCLNGEVLKSDEDRFERADGSVQWMRWETRPWYTGEVQEAVGGIIIFSEEITVQKKGQAELRNSQKLLRNIVDSTPGHIFAFDLNHRFTLSNAMMARDYGLTPQEVIGKTLYDIFPPDVADRLLATNRQILANGEFVALEELVPDKTGQMTRIMSTVKFPLQDAEGEIIGLGGVVMDITERRRVEAKLVASLKDNAELRVTMDAHAIVAATDARGRITFANDKFCEISQYSREELLGQDHRIINSGRHSKEFIRDLWTTIQTGRVWQGELNNRAKDGTFYWVDTTIVPFHDEDGGIRQYLSIRKDITARKQAETMLRESEERFRQLAENIQEVFWITDPAMNQVFYISPAYEEIWGRPCVQLYQDPHSWLEAIHPEDRARVLHAAKTRQTHGSYDETFRIQRPDGAVRWIHARSFPVPGPTGDVLRIVGTAQDITERRALEDQLRQSQKLEAVGQLAGGIAHDFNNLLTVINGYCEILLSKNPSETQHQSLSLVHKAGIRAAELTRQLLTFCRKQTISPEVLDLNVLVGDAEKMMSRIIGEQIGVITACEPDLYLIHADPGQVDQIIMNLVVNARDAMPQGGQITIATQNLDLDELNALEHPGVQPGAYVMLSITDTGFGMDDATKARIFEPFFTTKVIGKGTGLGLATVFGIVTQNKGHISVHSVPGQGSTFQIYWPRHQGTPKIDGSNRVTAPGVGGTETILLVEDDTKVRNLFRQALTSCGYEVLEARNGFEALQLALEHTGTIHLLATDVVMPQMGGPQLAECLVRSRPEIRILYFSGYNEDEMLQYGIESGQISFLHKPILPTSLADKVRELLDQQNSPGR